MRPLIYMGPLMYAYIYWGELNFSTASIKEAIELSMNELSRE